MRHHLNTYAKDNKEEVSALLNNVLQERGMKFHKYVKMMKGEITCGYEATLLILAKMFGMKILVIRCDYLWLSECVEPIICNVVLVQNNSGLFYGMKGNKKFDVGVVPKICTPKNKLLKSTVPHEKTSNVKVSRNTNSLPETSTSELAGEHDMKDTSTPKLVGHKKVFTFNLTLSPFEEKRNETGVDVQEGQCSDQKIRSGNTTVSDNVKEHASNDQKIHSETKCLGMGGPAKKLIIDKHKTASVHVMDISKEISRNTSVTVQTVRDCEKIVKFGCPICQHRSFTINGYHYQMFSKHQKMGT